MAYTGGDRNAYMRKNLLRNSGKRLWEGDEKRALE